MKIRLAEKRDVESMCTLWKEFIDFQKRGDRFFTRTEKGHKVFGNITLERMNENNWHVLVAEVDGKIVGHCVGAIQEYPPVYVKTKFGYFQDIAVAEDCRRRGIGSELVKEMQVWFKEHGVSRIELDVTATNEVSQGFWSAAGFSDFMIRKSKEMNIG